MERRQQQHHRQQQHQIDSGFSLELASQALAATGSRSTLKATEWILNQRRSADSLKMSSSIVRGTPGSQSKMDHFFLGSNAANSSQQPGGSRAATTSWAAQADRDSRDFRMLEEAENGDVGRSAHDFFDTSKPAPALVWQRINFDHQDGCPMKETKEAKEAKKVEDMGSSEYRGGDERAGSRSAEPRYILGRAGGSATAPAGAAARNEEVAGGSSVKVKHFTPQSAAIPIGVSGPSDKRQKEIAFDDSSPPVAKKQKENAAEFVSPRRFPSPIFPPPQPTKPKEQKLATVSSGTGRKSLAPLAERMRPATIDDVVGQDHLLGPRHLLRTMLDSDTVPSIILYGPPGTGKTSLARALARIMPGLRFVGLSAVISGTKEVREVLEEAKRVKKFGQKTMLFLDEVHRFNKAQQDLFLHSVEAGQIIFIGATTENPSFEINPALRSRCQVLTLMKLEPQHLRKVLERAIADREKGVFASLPESVSTGGDCVIKVEEEALNFLANAADGDARVALNAIEAATAAAYSATKLQIKSQQELVMPPAVLSVRSPGLERVGSSASSTGVAAGLAASVTERWGDVFGSKRLESLRETAKESSNSKEDYTKPFKKFVGGKEVTPRLDKESVPPSTSEPGREVRPLAAQKGDPKGSNPDATVPDRPDSDANGPSGVVIIVTLAQVQEAFQRSHILYDKTGEEHYNVISALHKSMRGGDADAAIYWLARMLEGGEGPLYVARRLIRFASEDVGLADPQAMVIANACYQACQFLGMPECNVSLAQCVVYLALSPKSVVVYQGIEAAQKMIKGTHQNEPVPLHLRNASTQLMKEMGYGKGYVYPPSQMGRVEQEYMPPSLQGHKFLVWPDV